MNLDTPLLGKQGHGVAFIGNGIPVQLMVGVVGQAVLIPRVPGRLSNQVTAFLHQQGLVTGNQVDRSETFLEQLGELAGLGLHGASACFWLAS